MKRRNYKKLVRKSHRYLGVIGNNGRFYLINGF